MSLSLDKFIGIINSSQMLVFNKDIVSFVSLLDSGSCLTIIRHFSNQEEIEGLSSCCLSFDSTENVSCTWEFELYNLFNWNLSHVFNHETKEFVWFHLIKISCGSIRIVGELFLTSLQNFLWFCMDTHLSVFRFPDNTVEFFDFLVNQNLLMRKRTSEILKVKYFNTVFLGLFIKVLIHNTRITTLWMHVKLHLGWVLKSVIMHNTSGRELNESDSWLHVLIRWERNEIDPILVW